MSVPNTIKSPVDLLRVSTTQAIVEHLKDRIQAGEFAPGAILPSERELQEQLGVSRLAVRESLARMSALGIIRVAHGKGAFVATEIDVNAIRDALTPLIPRNDFDRLRDLLHARALIEGDQAAEAARKRTAEDIRRLEEILRASPEVLEDPAAYGDLDFRFHQQVALIAGNVFLSAMWEALASHIRIFLCEFARDPEVRGSALQRHWIIVEAIAAGRPDKARELGRNHLKPCMEHYRKRLQSESAGALRIRRSSSKK
jgi:GntR family transcriptional repressor for pyruvate dehydrogenase complex